MNPNARSLLVQVDPDHVSRDIGFPLPNVPHRTDLPIEEGAELAGWRCTHRGHVLDSTPTLPTDAEDIVEAAMPKHDRGAYVTDPSAIRRRLQAVGTPKTRREFRKAFEAYALSPDWFAPSPERDAAASCTDSLWPWDCFGAALDHAAAEDARRQAEEAEARRRAEEEARKPNTLSLAALGLVGVFVPLDAAPHSWPDLIHPSADMPFTTKDVRQAGLPVDGGHILLFRNELGLEFREGTIGGSSASFVTSFVPEKVPAKKPMAMSMSRWLDARGADDSPLTTFRDRKTEEGRAAEDAFRQHMGPLMHRVAGLAAEKAGTVAPDVRRDYGRLFFQTAVRGYGLRRELAMHVYADELGQLGARIGARVEPLPAGRVEQFIAEAMQGKRSWISPDEFFGAEDTAEDRWSNVIDAATKGKDTVTTEDLESALVAAKLVTGALSTKGHQRLIRLMADKGYEKRQVSVNGQRTRAFVRRATGKSFFARLFGGTS